jgi:hypothetical protein
MTSGGASPISRPLRDQNRRRGPGGARYVIKNGAAGAENSCACCAMTGGGA